MNVHTEMTRSIIRHFISPETATNNLTNFQSSTDKTKNETSGKKRIKQSIKIAQ